MVGAGSFAADKARVSGLELRTLPCQPGRESIRPGRGLGPVLTALPALNLER